MYNGSVAGAGVVVTGGAAVIDGCTFSGNVAATVAAPPGTFNAYGAGLLLDADTASNVSVTACTFVDNSATSDRCDRPWTGMMMLHDLVARLQYRGRTFIWIWYGRSRRIIGQPSCHP